MPTKVRRRVTQQTLYVVVAPGNGRPYISGVFDRMARAHAYVLEIPEGLRALHNVTSVECRFPLFVLEDRRGFRFFGSGEILDAVAAYREGDRADNDYEHAVLYRFESGYRPEAPGADEMGSTRHWHISNETLDGGCFVDSGSCAV